MQIQIIQVPYDSGHRSARMGRGPECLLHGGLDAALRARGYAVRVDCVEADGAFPAEIHTAFELHRRLAGIVRSAAADAWFPLVLAGNCNSALGTVSGLGPAPVGVIWFDAHGDFNTPETTTSGFLDGMALTTLTGRCWSALSSSIPGFAPISDPNVLHLGGRDFEPAERELLGRSAVTVLGVERFRHGAVRPTLEPALTALQARVERVYLHIDMDVLDPDEATANQFASPGGLSLAQLEDAIRTIGERFVIGAAALTAYDPSYDPAGRMVGVGVRLAEVISTYAT